MATKKQLLERWKVEPGLTIRQKIIDYHLSRKWKYDATPEENAVNQTIDSAVIFGLLDGLPFRDEVPNGRDLRGSDLAGAMRSDFSHTDFSFCFDTTDFFHCDLRGAKFDGIVTDHASFRDKLSGASFCKAKLRSCHFNGSDARNCCFDGADLYHATFQKSDLRGSSFVGANCKMATFATADIRNCDFRGAILEEATFMEAVIDKTTDFRGASLINAYHGDNFDRAGNLISHGVDLKLANYDETTKFGEDEVAKWIDVWNALIEFASHDHGEDGLKIAASVTSVKERAIRSGRYDERYWDDILAPLNERQRQLYKEIEPDAWKSLL